MKDKIQKVQIVNQPIKTHDSMEKPHKMLPTLSLDSEDLPAIKDWSVGKKYTLMVEVEQTSMSKGDEYGPMSDMHEEKHMPMRARFKILSVKVPGEDKPMSRNKKVEAMKKKAEEY